MTDTESQPTRPPSAEEVGALRAARSSTDWIPTVNALLEQGVSKAAIADALEMDRIALHRSLGGV
ncbi:MAG: hypothetical protein HOQ43_10695 [Glycomyces artemisiae]|uniref:Uncharacterized protein n=1 Tax=Glycomyces artemisiae TaxID=1076443 RepID=A0A850C9L1_9ACTN|nr:hypothetical protein [Glycomyces artemisiae]